MDKNSILDQVDVLLTDQLFDFINQGTVTLDELKNTGNLDASIRRAIIDKLSKQKKDNEDAEKKLVKEDDDLWKNSFNENTEVSYSEYINRYPNGRHVLEAKHLKSDLEKERIKKEKDIQDTIEAISKSPNDFAADDIRRYLKDNLVSADKLIQNGIPERIIAKLNKNESAPDFELGTTPKSIPDGFTEVYFWGIRGSGKTTALAAVLSTANNEGLLEIAQGPGFNYMLQLQNLFAETTSILPTGTPSKNTQYLPFTLKERDEKHARSVSLIELSGEIFQCFLYKNAGNKLPTSDHQETFDTLLNYLKGNNRKMHFFFVDYNKENTPDQDGYTQSQYLNAATTFFNNPEYNIFGRTTDAIYIVVTKSDLMPSNSADAVSKYLNDRNYKGFVNSLRNKCRKHHINGGRILGTPFSLGNVYFEEICEFNPHTAKNIIDILMRRISPNGKNILDVFNK